MNVHTLIHPASRARGITLVEILMVISLLIIIAAFALPSARSASARAEMKAAMENLSYSIDTARNVARLTESDVSLSIAPAPDDRAQVVRFSGIPGQPRMQDYRLPDGILLTSSRDRFVFDHRGRVDNPGRIMLVSRVDDDIFADLAVN